MWVEVVFVFVAVFCLGLVVGSWVKKSVPKLDGKLVITQDDGKTLMSFEFDNEDRIVELRNKQVVSFRIVGPERIASVDDS